MGYTMVIVCTIFISEEWTTSLQWTYKLAGPNVSFRQRFHYIYNYIIIIIVYKATTHQCMCTYTYIPMHILLISLHSNYIILNYLP